MKRPHRSAPTHVLGSSVALIEAIRKASIVCIRVGGFDPDDDGLGPSGATTDFQVDKHILIGIVNKWHGSAMWLWDVPAKNTVAVWTQQEEWCE